ncbi:MAG: hypothetical protein ACTSQH_06915 [Candidatus Hodarchaeales archaeon]
MIFHPKCLPIFGLKKLSNEWIDIDIHGRRVQYERNAEQLKKRRRNVYYYNNKGFNQSHLIMVKMIKYLTY